MDAHEATVRPVSGMITRIIVLLLLCYFSFSLSEIRPCSPARVVHKRRVGGNNAGRVVQHTVYRFI